VLPGASLTPADVKDRAVMEQWISIETSNFTPQAMKVIYQDLFNKHLYNKPSDPAIVADGRAGTGRVLDIVEKHLDGKEYLAGGMFSLADVNYMPYIQYLFAAGHGDLITSRPNVSAWWTRNAARPTWKKVVS
jgi:glutathione S-transferase